MEDTLQEQRQYFDERLAELSQIEDPEARYKLETSLVFAENQAEFAYRSGLARGKVMGLDLEESMPDIIDGMNKSCLRVLFSDLTSWSSPKHYQESNRTENDALLRFALDYVDRWVMYNNLFNQEK